MQRSPGVIDCGLAMSFIRLGPYGRGGTAGEEVLLADCYRNCMKLAIEHSIKTIAFPAISTGVYRFPLDRATAIAVETVTAALTTETGVEAVTFCCFGRDAADQYRAALQDAG